MNKKIFSLVSCSLLFVGMSTVSFAQQEDSTYNENVIVTGSYKPILEEMPKIHAVPTITDMDNELRHDFSYSIKTRRLTSLFAPSRIKAARVVAEPRPRLYNNYIRLGLGTYWSPLLEAYFNSTANKNLTYGASLSHHSSWGTIGKKSDDESYYGPSYFSLTDVTLFGSYNKDNRIHLQSDLTYQNDYNLYYGFNNTTLDDFFNMLNGNPSGYQVGFRDDISVKDYRATYNYVGWNVGFKLLPNQSSQWAFDADLKVADMWTNHNQNELNIGSVLQVSHPYAFSKSFAPLLALRVKADVFVNKCGFSNMPIGFAAGTVSEIPNETRTLVDINPFINFVIAKINVHAGCKLTLDGYTHPHSMRGHFFPDVTASRNFLNDAFVVNMGIIGEDRANSWNNTRLLNPYSFLSDDLRTVEQYSMFGQVHYKISRKLHLNLKASYNLYYDYQTFQRDPRFLINNVFMPKYESFNQLVLKGDFTFINDEMITFEVGGTYYKGKGIGGDKMPGLYHPSYDAHLNIHVNYNDKLYIHIQSQLLSKLSADYGYDPVEDKYVITEELPMRYGIGIDVEYRHNRALSFFIKANNLAFQRYYYWLNYPSQKGQIMGGLTYTIH